MISFRHKGDFSGFSKYIGKIKKSIKLSNLDRFGKEGVAALSSATPVESGKTASSWKYDIFRKRDSISIVFSNTNVVNGVPVAIILQYGHATGNGGYVQGRDYINPAIRPVFDDIANNAWKEVSGK